MRSVAKTVDQQNRSGWSGRGHRDVDRIRKVALAGIAVFAAMTHEPLERAQL
jgi:hypothetical protein